MQIQTAVSLLEILSVPRSDALTNTEIGRKFYGKPTLESNELRNIQRYTKALSSASKDGPALIEAIGSGRDQRFYHKKSSVAHWLMTEEAALNILLTRQILGQTFGSVEQMGTKEIGEIAEKVADASDQTRRIRDRVRVVHDWIGRQPAIIPSNILKETIDAVANNRQLRFTYLSPAGKTIQKTVSPQGLVAKDGSLYLLGTEGLSDLPSAGLPLHRMKNADRTNQEAQFRPDFDLDRYIEDTHQLSHKLDANAPPVELSLRVAPESIYHFRERALSKNQTISPATPSDGWFVVTATVPHTVLLVPFLLSMGGWIEVLGPSTVREEMSERVRTMASHYAGDSAP